MFLMIGVSPSILNLEMQKIMNKKYFNRLNLIMGDRNKSNFINFEFNSLMEQKNYFNTFKNTHSFIMGSYDFKKERTLYFFGNNASIIQGNCDNWEDVCNNYNLKNIKSFSEAVLKVYLEVFKIRKSVSSSINKMLELFNGNYSIMIYDFSNNQIGILNKNKNLYIKKIPGNMLIIKTEIFEFGDFPYDGFIKMPNNSSVVYACNFISEKDMTYNILNEKSDKKCFIINNNFGLETAVGIDALNKILKENISVINILPSGEENNNANIFASQKFNISHGAEHVIELFNDPYFFNIESDDYLEKLGFLYSSIIKNEKYSVCFISSLYDDGHFADIIRKYLNIQNHSCEIIEIFKNEHPEYLAAYSYLNSLEKNMYVYDCERNGESSVNRRKYSPCGSCERCKNRIFAFDKINKLKEDSCSNYYISDKYFGIENNKTIDDKEINTFSIRLMEKLKNDILKYISV